MSEKSGLRRWGERATEEPLVREEEEGEPRAPVTHQKRRRFGLGFNFFKDQNNPKRRRFRVLFKKKS